MPQAHDFFRFGSKIANLQAHARNLPHSEVGTPTRHWGPIALHVGHYDGIDMPVIFDQNRSGTFKDIVDTGTGILHLVSDRFVNLLVEHQFTGWKTFPVVIHDRKGGIITGYHGFSITGRCGQIDYSKSAREQRQNAPHLPVYTRLVGVYPDLDQWDGTDFFIPQRNLAPHVSKRAAEVLLKHRITNCSIRPLSEIELPIEVLGFTPKFLEDWE